MNSNTIKSFLVALAVSSAVAAPVHAEVLTQFNMDEFASADYDGDECIDAEEFRNVGALVFHGWDSNGDNLLSGEELFGGASQNESVTAASVDLASYQQELMRSHGVADKDGNGCLSRAEWGEKK